MAAQPEFVLAQSPSMPLPGEQVDDQASIFEADTTRSSLSPRGQFDRYMADVKKTALLSPDKLLDLARQAYVHRFNILKTLSSFPPCAQALSDQFDYHNECDFRLSNFVTGYGDQSVTAKDHLLELNFLAGKGEACDKLDLKSQPKHESRLKRTLENLSHYCKEFQNAEPSVRRSSTSSLRKNISETYMFISLRYDEYDRHRKLFEEITDEFERLADALYSLVDVVDHPSLLDSFSTNDIDKITQLVPTDNQSFFRSQAVRLQRLVQQVGLSIKDVGALRARYKHHVDQQQRLVNRIIQSNLLLSARETIRFHPKDDRLFDTCQEANQGLITAAYRYDYWKGYAFSTFACYWIKQRLMRQRDQTVNGVYSIPCSISTRAAKIHRARTENGQDPKTAMSASNIAKQVKCSVAQVDEAIQAYTPVINSEEVFSLLETAQPNSEDIACLCDLQDVVRKALDSLPDNKRDVCKMRWGIGYPKSMTLAEVSKLHGTTKERVRNIEHEGLKLLREGDYADQLEELHDIT